MSLRATKPPRNTAIENQRVNLAKMEFPGRAAREREGGERVGRGSNTQGPIVY